MKEYTEEMVRLIIEGAIQLEREACAKLCDAECNPAPNEGHITTYQSGGYIIAEYLASAIRSRGQE
jgi:hypothetical protein